MLPYAHSAEDQGYLNPHGVLPAPAPSVTTRPVGYWESNAAGIAWSTAGIVADSVNRLGLWQTAIFDLRPDVDSATSRRSTAYRLQRTVGMTLHVQISGLTAVHTGMSLYSRMLGHPYDSTKVGVIEPDTDETGSLSTGADTAMLSYLVGGGYPPRYWALQLRFSFNNTDVPAALPRITVEAAAY